MMAGPREDHELALAAQAGDREALGVLVERWRLRLFGVAYGVLHHYEDARDAVASGLLQVCRHASELRRPEQMAGWMACIVRNEARLLRRRRRSEEPLEELDLRAPEMDLPLRLDIELALRRLPGEQARALRLFYLEGLSLEEIAEEAGRPAGTVKSWLSRGRRRLAREIEEYAIMTPATASSPAPEPAPGWKALVVYSDLDERLVGEVRRVLERAAFQPVLLPSPDPMEVLSVGQSCQALVLDEWLNGRSSLELLLHWKASPETRTIPVCLLCSAPSTFTVSACFAAGVDRLIDKEDAGDLARIAAPFPSASRLAWHRMTERARRMVFFAQEEAARLQSPEVRTEHLLLAFAREDDHGAARILQRLGTTTSALREALLCSLSPAAPRAPALALSLAPETRRAVELAQQQGEELGHAYLGTDHLLLGLALEQQGRGGRVLRELGATVERIREHFSDPAPAAGGAGQAAPSRAPDVLAMLPVREPVYFPHNSFPLFVGRSRSLAALGEAAESKWVVLTTQRDQAQDDPEPCDLYEVGVLAEIIDLADLGDGNRRAYVEARRRVRILEYLETEPFFRVRYEPLPAAVGSEAEALALGRAVAARFQQYAERRGDVPAEAIRHVLEIRDPDQLVDTIAPWLLLTTAGHQELLQTAAVHERLEKVGEILGRAPATSAGTPGSPQSAGS